IFTLLQPQIVRTGLLPQAQTLPNWKAPTSRDIPPVVLSNIPKTDPSAIQAYLSLIGSSYDILRRVKAVVEKTESSATTQSQQPSLKQTISDLRLDSYQSRRPSAQSITGDNERRSSVSRPKGPSTAPLSTVPSIYFDCNFHLENPRTFDFVTERSDIIRSPQHVEDKGKPKNDGVFPPTGRKALATNAILQEKLSWYLDTVEIHLITSISNASTTFFTALGSLQALHAEATASVDKIQALRNDLLNLDSDMALGGLQVVQLQQRRENVRRLTEATTQLQEVITSVNSCEKLIGGGDYMTGLDELEDVIKLLAGEPPKRQREAFQRLSENMRLVDLRRLHVLDGASNDIDELRNRIRSGLEREFCAMLLQDIRKHVESVSTAATLSRLGSLLLSSKRISRALPPQEPAYMVVDNDLKTKLRSQISGLHRVNYAAAAATTYKTETFRELKGIVRRHLPSASDDDTLSTASGHGQNGRPLNQQERSSILARNLRQLDHEDAYTMLSKIYANTSESLRRLGTQIKILLDIISDLEDKQEEPSRSSSLTRNRGGGRDGSKSRSASPMQHPRNRILDILDMSNLLTQAIELVQGQIVKVLRVRSDQTTKLPLTEFIRYFSLNKLFVTECEAISGSGSVALNSLINGQIKDFVGNFGDSQLRRLIQVMDSDRWDAKDFGDEEKQRLSNILETEFNDPEVWTSTSKIWEEPKPTEGPESQSTSTDSASVSAKEKVRTATIGGQKYVLPESALVMLNILEDFLHLIAEMPSMIPDIAPRLLDCLKLFNSRSSQLILGAGATRSAGLKNITTKHLALASQALSFIIALIPYLSEFIRRHSITSSHVAEFDKVKRLYQDHQNGIHEKLVEIMSSRASVHVAAMKKIDWDAVEDTKATSPYMEVLTKETGTLYRVLSKHLPSSTVAIIMKPVFENYKRQWSDAFQSATILTELGRERMLSDLELFKSRIDRIEGSGDLSDYLISLVKAKTVIPTPKVSTPENTSELAGST
ncbi:hypothetical protein KEM54_006735, partial [Ascosphaera aggregata]